MKKLIIIAAAALVLVCCPAQARKGKICKVVYKTTGVHCKNCVKKVTENISFEKGVEDLVVSLENKTIEVKFDAAKTDTARIANAIRKLGYTATAVEFKEAK